MAKKEKSESNLENISLSQRPDYQISKFLSCQKSNSTRGKGFLKCKHDTKWECNFEISQLLNGRLFIILSIQTEIFLWDKLEHNLSNCYPFSVEGIDFQNQKVHIDNINFTNAYPLDMMLVGYGQTAQISNSLLPLPEMIDIEYNIINFRLNQMVTPIKIVLNGFSFEINNLSYIDGSRTKEHSIAYRHPIVSANIEGRDISSNELNKIQSNVETICWLLSIACRKHVFIASRTISSNKLVIKNYFEPTFTQIGHIRDLIPNGSVREFLSASFERINGEFRGLNLGITVDHYLQALILRSAWALSVGIITAMEALKSELWKFRGEKDEQFQYWIAPIEYDQQKEEISEEIIKVLVNHFSKFKTLGKEEKLAIKTQINNINYRSYRTQLKRIFDLLQISYTKVELNNFIKVRNLIIHYGDLENQRDNLDWKNAKMAIALFEKTLLAVLGYKGKYEPYNYDDSNSIDQTI